VGKDINLFSSGGRGRIVVASPLEKNSFSRLTQSPKAQYLWHQPICGPVAARSASAPSIAIGSCVMDFGESLSDYNTRRNLKLVEQTMRAMWICVNSRFSVVGWFSPPCLCPQIQGISPRTVQAPVTPKPGPHHAGAFPEARILQTRAETNVLGAPANRYCPDATDLPAVNDRI